MSGGERERAVEAAATLRRAQVARAESTLGAAREVREAARQELEVAQATLATHREQAPPTPGEGSGEIGAAALQRAASFALAHAERTRELARDASRAEQALAGADRAVHEATEALARAHADAEVVERHRDRHARDQARRKVLAEEEDP